MKFIFGVLIIILILFGFLFYFGNEIDRGSSISVTLPDTLEITGDGPQLQSDIPVQIDESPTKAIRLDEEKTQLVGTDELSATEVTISIPATYDTPLPFVSQAPFGNWALPYQEACEEASLITVAEYLAQRTLTKESMDRSIRDLVTWEINNKGVYTDTSVAEVAVMAREYFGLKTRLVTGVTIDLIKSELAAGNLIIAPFAGRELGNPFFKAPGPLYHMLVIRGYTKREFITNDVGTSHGDGYKYKFQTLIDALHDLPLTADGEVFRPYDLSDVEDSTKEAAMLTGEQVVLVIEGH